MKLAPAALMFAMIAATAGAAEGPAMSTTTPKPRVRLDPTSHTAVAEPVRVERASSPPGTIYMDKYFVRDRSAAPRRKTPDPQRPFRFADGGRFAGKEIGAVQVDVGFWTHIDIMEDDARFRPPQTHQLFDILRIRW